jgi:predicted porin
MKKNVIALAVAAAMAAPLAAQAAPTVYGKVRVSIDSIDRDSAATKEDGLNVSDRVSRVGIKGSEDLGGGMKAIYGAEWGMNVTDASTTAAGDKTSGLTQRNAFVGLSGGFGTALVGRHDTPYKMVGSADVFGDTAADSQGKGQIIGYNGFDTRANNAVAYVSPDLNGWTIMAALVAGESQDASPSTTDANSLDAATSIGVKGAIGPVKVGLGYETYNKDAFGTTKDKTGTKLDLKYAMGTMGFGLTVEASNNGSDNKQDQGILGSFTYGMGANVLAIQYGQVDEHKDHGDNDFTRTAVGLIHNFSKATNTYIAYAADDYSESSDAGKQYSAITLGLNTKF